MTSSARTFRTLPLYLGLRYLRRRRAAWLALAAVTLTVAVPIAVMGVMQGWIDIMQRQLRADPESRHTPR